MVVAVLSSSWRRSPSSPVFLSLPLLSTVHHVEMERGGHPIARTGRASYFSTFREAFTHRQVHCLSLHDPTIFCVREGVMAGSLRFNTKCDAPQLHLRTFDILSVTHLLVRWVQGIPTPVGKPPTQKDSPGAILGRGEWS